MKTLLIQPPNSYENEAWKYDNIPDCPPLSLLVIAAELEAQGIETEIIDAIDGTWPLHRLKERLTSDVKVVGITSMTANIRGSVQVAEFVRQQSDAKIVLGGSHVSADPDIVNRYQCFDYGVLREGDITFPKLVQAIGRGTAAAEFPVAIIEGEIPEDLNALPLPKWDAPDWEFYKKRRGLWTNAIFASRGCPYACSFCSIPAIAKTVRYNSPERIVEEIEVQLELTGIKYFTFADDLFTLKRKWVIEVCQAIIDAGLHKKIRWNAQARINTVDDRMLGWMKRAGCYNLAFGVESGSERIRQEVIGKRITNDQVIEVTRLCRRHGMEADWYLILGFQTETREDMEETMRLPLEAEPNVIGIHLNTPLPGAPQWNKIIAEGRLPSDTVDRYIRGELGPYWKGCWPYYVPEGFTLKEVIEFRDKIYRRFYRRPKYIAYRLVHDFRSWTKLKQDFRHAASLLRRGASDDDATVLNEWHSVHTVGGWYDTSNTDRISEYQSREEEKLRMAQSEQQRLEVVEALAVYDPDDGDAVTAESGGEVRPEVDGSR